MKDWLIYSIGFLAQIFFSGRLIFQWLASEKAKKVVAPSLFWVLSLSASFLLFVYGWLRDDFAIVLGQSISYFIYIRNLQLEGKWRKVPRLARWVISLFPLVVFIFSFNNGRNDLEHILFESDIPTPIILWGSIAQLIFTTRFIYQWIYSEKHKESSLPRGFWILSSIGSSMILIYAILREDPVLLVGHSMGLFVYLRNLMLLKNEKN